MADPRVAAFDLNVRLEEDDNGNLAFDLNEPILESGNDNGNHLSCLSLLFPSSAIFSDFLFHFWTGFDLNLPLDEYGAVDFDYIQNLAGNFFSLFFPFFDYFLCNPWLTRRMFFF